MKNIFLKKLKLTIAVLAVFLVASACGSSSGESPSAEIPAPVSHLSISSPDSDGLVRVTADAGFADGGSAITISVAAAASEDTSAFPVMILFWIGSAQAQTTSTLTAGTDGSFQTTLAATAGDTISVAYTKDEAPTTVTDSVPENKPALPSVATGVEFEDVVYNPTTGGAIVLANDGTDGFLIFFNLDTQASSTVTLSGISGANRFDLDDTNQILIIADADDANNVFHYHIPTGNTPSDATDGNQVTDIAVAPSGNYGILAFDSASPAIAYYDVVTDDIPVTGTATDGSGNNQAGASVVAVDNNGSNDVAALVSEASGGGFFLSTYMIDSATPALTQQTSTTLTGLGSVGGFAFFNQAAEALVTDSTNDHVLSVVVATGTLTAIDTEGDPVGVAVNSADSQAYVVNRGERTLSVIDLSDFSVSRGDVLGLAPTAIAVDPTGSSNTVIVLNSGDKTLTLFTP